MMSIDYGEKRVGIALSDPMHTISYPLCTIDRSNTNNLIDEILEISNNKNVETIIIGLPLSMSGSHSAQTKKVIKFRDVLLEKILDNKAEITVDFIDERLSSVSAKNIMIQQGIKTGHNKSKVDKLSAAIILQEYLDSK